MCKKLHHNVEVVITTKPPITLNYFKYVEVFISYFRPYRYYILKISHKELVTTSAETIFFSLRKVGPLLQLFSYLYQTEMHLCKNIFLVLFENRQGTRFPSKNQVNLLKFFYFKRNSVQMKQI